MNENNKNLNKVRDHLENDMYINESTLYTLVAKVEAIIDVLVEKDLAEREDIEKRAEETLTKAFNQEDK